MTRKTVAVIVNHNGAALLPSCVHSLLALGMHDLTLLVVDNASGDDPRSYVPIHQSVELLRLPDNVGFAGAAFAGVEQALRDSEISAIAVLNNDLVFDQSFEPLLRSVSEGRWPEGLYAPVLVNPNGTTQNMGEVWSRKTGIVKTRLSNTSARTEDGLLWLTGNEFLCGAAIVGNASVFRTVRFDADLVLVCEDLDLCMQAHASGIPMAVAMNCRVVHAGSATFRKTAGVYGYYHWRNGPLMTARWGSTAEFYIRLAVLPLQLVRTLLGLVKRRDFRSVLPLLCGAMTGMRRAVEYRILHAGVG